jgi:hypothetical protein
MTLVMQQCRRCRAEIAPGQNFCPQCGRVVDDVVTPQRTRAKRRMRPRTVRLLGQVIAGAMSGAVTAALALIFAFYVFAPEGGQPQIVVVSATPFEERTPRGHINASDLVPIADSTFLIVDDLTDDAFFELSLSPDGKKSKPLLRRPILGLGNGLVEDLEGAALVEESGQRYIVSVSSLEGNEGENTEAGLVRVAIDASGALRGEIMPGFRNWLLASYPELANAPSGPDAIDIQGVVYDSDRDALLIGVRSATSDGRLLMLPVQIRDWAGAWTTENLQRLDPIRLDASDAAAGVPKGIYGIARHTGRGDYVLILGNSEGEHADAGLYRWDGRGSILRRLPRLHFHPDMQPEGIAFGTIHGRQAAVLVDDTGGYYVIWQDELM